MQPTSHTFKENVRRALADETLQSALANIKHGFVEKRRAAVDNLPEFDALRDQAKAIKDHALAHLDLYLERYEEQVIAAGGKVHWCANADAARKAILRICRSVNARSVTKGKSMVAEEIGLNEFLEANGITPVETDLGEYIIQVRNEPPSHIIAPAVHVTKQQVAEDFRRAHADLPSGRRLDDAPALVSEARQVLRRRYVEADVGLTGANFLVAETGSSVIVTNEGNGDLTQLLPKVHIVVASLEKVIPTLEDLSTILRVLARSATGQEFSSYTTVSTGPRRREDADGPEEYHVILLDNGRSAMLGTEFQDILRCIRCGACMNHCPVYHAIGGHAYGWVYPGPMGAVLTPSLIGVEQARHLPNASTFCGRCEEVCPMRIPLPKMMRHWREREFERHLSSSSVRTGLGLWAFLARRPTIYHSLSGLSARLLHLLGRRNGGLRRLPLAGGWTRHRDLPIPQGQTFQQLWSARERRRRRSGRRR